MKLITAFVASLLVSHSAAAAVFIVNNTSDVPDATPGNGACNPVNAAPNTCTLRAAIMESNALGGSHTIVVASGTYELTRPGISENLANTGDLDITAEIVIVNGTNSPPFISGTFQDRVFHVLDGGDLTLTNIHVGRGMADFQGSTNGGAINVAGGATLSLDEVEISESIAGIGGGIYSDGTVTVIDSEFLANQLSDTNVQTSFVGGAAILSRGILDVSRSTFRLNGVSLGDQFKTQEYAIEVREGFVANPVTQIFNSTFYGNSRGVFSDEVPIAIYQSTFSQNGQLGLRFLPKVADINSEQLTVIASVFNGHVTDCNGPYGDEAAYNIEDNSNASSDATCSFTGASDFEDIENPFLDDEPTDHGGKTLVLMPNPDQVLVDPPGGTCVTNQDQRERSRPLKGNSNGAATCDIGSVEFDTSTDPRPNDLFEDSFEDLDLDA